MVHSRERESGEPILPSQADAEIHQFFERGGVPLDIFSDVTLPFDLQRNNRFRDVARFTERVKPLAESIGYKRTPFWYQLSGAMDVNRMWQTSKVAGAYDEYGMGKTTLALLAWMGRRTDPKADAEQSRFVFIGSNKQIDRAFEEWHESGIPEHLMLSWKGDVSVRGGAERLKRLSKNKVPIVLLTYEALREKALLDALDSFSATPDIVTVDEFHELKMQHGAYLSERSEGVLSLSDQASKRGGRGLLMSATPMTKGPGDHDMWRTAWRTSQIPFLSRGQEDFYEMPPIKTQFQELDTGLQRPDAHAEARAAFAWLHQQFIPQVLEDPEARVLVYSQHVNNDSDMGDVSLRRLSDILTNQGIAMAKLYYGNLTQRTETVSLITGKGALCSYETGAESYTLNAPGLRIYQVLLSPPDKPVDLPQAIARTFRPIGTGAEPITVIIPVAQSTRGESTTRRQYNELIGKLTPTHELTGRKPEWMRTVSTRESSYQYNGEKPQTEDARIADITRALRQMDTERLHELIPTLRRLVHIHGTEGYLFNHEATMDDIRHELEMIGLPNDEQTIRQLGIAVEQISQSLLSSYKNRGLETSPKAIALNVIDTIETTEQWKDKPEIRAIRLFSDLYTDGKPDHSAYAPIFAEIRHIGLRNLQKLRNELPFHMQILIDGALGYRPEQKGIETNDIMDVARELNLLRTMFIQPDAKAARKDNMQHVRNLLRSEQFPTTDTIVRQAPSLKGVITYLERAMIANSDHYQEQGGVFVEDTLRRMPFRIDAQKVADLLGIDLRTITFPNGTDDVILSTIFAALEKNADMDTIATIAESPTRYMSRRSEAGPAYSTEGEAKLLQTWRDDKVIPGDIRSIADLQHWQTFQQRLHSFPTNGFILPTWKNGQSSRSYIFAIERSIQAYIKRQIVEYKYQQGVEYTEDLLQTLKNHPEAAGWNAEIVKLISFIQNFTGERELPSGSVLTLSSKELPQAFIQRGYNIAIGKPTFFDSKRTDSQDMGSAVPRIPTARFTPLKLPAVIVNRERAIIQPIHRQPTSVDRVTELEYLAKDEYIDAVDVPVTNQSRIPKNRLIPIFISPKSMSDGLQTIPVLDSEPEPEPELQPDSIVASVQDEELQTADLLEQQGDEDEPTVSEQQLADKDQPVTVDEPSLEDLALTANLELFEDQPLTSRTTERVGRKTAQQRRESLERVENDQVQEQFIELFRNREYGLHAYTDIVRSARKLSGLYGRRPHELATMRPHLIQNELRWMGKEEIDVNQIMYVGGTMEQIRRICDGYLNTAYTGVHNLPFKRFVDEVTTRIATKWVYDTDSTPETNAEHLTGYVQEYVRLLHEEDLSRTYVALRFHNPAEALQDLHETIALYPPSTVMSVIAELPRRLQTAVLQLSQYTDSSERVVDFAARKGIDHARLYGDLRAAVPLIRQRLQAIPLSDTAIFPEIDSKQLVQQVDEYKYARDDYRVINRDDVRNDLAHLPQEKLDAIEPFLNAGALTIFKMLRQFEEQDIYIHFRYTVNDIATETGRTPLRVTQVGRQVRELLKEDLSTIKLSTKGERIEPDSWQGRILAAAPRVTNRHLASLSSSQLAMFRHLTIPNENGRYHTIKSFTRDSEDYQILASLLAKITTEPTDINRLVAGARFIVEHPKGVKDHPFRPIARQVAPIILDLIERGEPLDKNFERIATQYGIPYQRFTQAVSVVLPRAAALAEKHSNKTDQ